MNKTWTEVESPIDVIESLLDGKEDIMYVYNSHYGVYLHFYLDGHIEVTDEHKEYTWYPTDKPSKYSVRGTCRQIYIIWQEVADLLPRIPWGNLEDMGGRRAVIEILYRAGSIRHYSDFEPRSE